MHAVGILGFLTVAALLWLYLARGRHAEEQAAHRRFSAGSAEFWTARLQADDARRAGDAEQAGARLHECARRLGELRRRAADLPGASGGEAVARERYHEALEELRRMQDSMLRTPLEAAERQRVLAHGAGLARGAAEPERPGRPLRYGEPDALERGLRFGFGFFFGVGLAFLITLEHPLSTDGANLLVLAGMAAVCGLLALRFGDRFWEWISDNLWWIRRAGR